MRFLIDRCVSRHVARLLRTLDHDVSETRDRGPDPGDDRMLGWAVAEERILGSLEKGFGGLARHRKLGRAGVVRLPDVLPDEQARLIGRRLGDHPEEAFAGAIIVIKGNRVRFSRP